MPKEIQINGKWYWKLEPKDEIQLFSALPEALMWQDEDLDIVATKKIATKKILVFCRGPKESPTDYPFIAEDGNAYAHCALLSSEHKRKSRRCTVLELAKWCDKNGFWINAEGTAVTKTSFFYETRNDECDGNLISICTWDGEPMEPTAQNMGLEE